MKLLVLGATGATGRLVVDQALVAGHTVRELVHSPQKLDARPGLDVVAGQATDFGDVTQAMSGVGAVIGTLRAVGGTVITRFVELSSFAVLRERLSAPAMLMPRVKGKAAAEDALRASDLDYTLVHAVRLTNGPAAGVTKLLPESATLRMGDTVSRADVAAWMLTALTDTTTSRRSVVIAG
ncbi:NAD(P)H-binding [Streptomyces sp. cf124]|uniref:NAD(P)-dependent oxidoreductase n=1 Tax=Streptomyces TaxID=1883 RepID=UPI0008E29401|nr:NAD(P)-binding oxidoreductase [Streptomyces sp. cf124]SFM54669.1 NAD(P)H-binding [Streptomyces sp. cf124]